MSASHDVRNADALVRDADKLAGLVEWGVLVSEIVGRAQRGDEEAHAVASSKFDEDNDGPARIALLKLWRGFCVPLGVELERVRLGLPAEN